MGQLVDSWIEDISKLSEIVRIEPHIAYTAYGFGFQHKYTYLMRTLPDIEELYLRLDAAVDGFICAMLNKWVNCTKSVRVPSLTISTHTFKSDGYLCLVNISTKFYSFCSI